MLKRTKRRGFTLIELIVVMAVIGILVLLAAPRFLGQTARARESAILNDIKVAEGKVGEHLMRHEGFTDEWLSAEKNDLTDKVAVGTLYGREGVVSDVDGNEYRLIPAPFIKTEVRSSLEGAFYANGDGDVYYADIATGKEKPEQPAIENQTYEEWLDAVEASPNSYVWATDADFTYVLDDEAPDGKGYYKYSGEDDYVMVPKFIKGELQTHYYMMFRDSDVLGVAANHPDVTSLSYMFYRWESEVGGLELDHLNTHEVTDMSSMFGDAIFHVPYRFRFTDTSKVTDMKRMFSTMTFNKDVDFGLEDMDTSNVTDMYEMFFRTYIAEEAIFNFANFDTRNVTDMGFMFSELYFETSMPEWDFANFDTSKVTDMEGMFESLYVEEGSIRLDLRNFDTSKVTIMSVMFGNASIEHLDVRNFDTSSVVDMRRMFEGLELTQLDLRNFDTSSVTDMDSMFAYFKTSTPLDLSNFNTSNATSMREMFEYAVISELDLSSFDTANAVMTFDRWGRKQEGLVDMFEGTAATVGYARNQQEADRFNNATETNIPGTLTFTVQ